MAQENSVSFKVFLTKEGSTDQPEVRRFGIDRDVVSNFSYLREKLQMVYPSLKSATFTVNWKDTDGDTVLISSDDELMIALTEMQVDVRKLYVTMKGSNGGAQPEGSLPVHSGVSCDGCNMDVRGFRYKCLMCPDFDLCATCENAGAHSEHFMVRMPVPINWRPSFGRRLSHHLSKSARKSEGCHWTGDPTECQMKSAFQEGVGPHRGRHHRGHHGGHHGGPHWAPHGGPHGGPHEGPHAGPHGGPHEGPHWAPHGGPHGGHHGGPHGGLHGEPRCQRAGGLNWLDTLAGYLSEWSNLAGETAPPCESGRAAAGAAPAPAGSEQTNEQLRQQQEYRAEQHTKYLQSIGETVANMLDPFGIDVDVQIRSDSDKTPSKPAATTSRPPTQDTETAVKEVSAQMSAVNIDADAGNVEMSAPSDPEGWTVLNGADAASTGAVPRTSATPPVTPDPAALAQEAMQAVRAAQEAQRHALAAQAQAQAHAMQAQGFAPIYPNLPAQAPVVPLMGAQLNPPQFRLPSQGLPPPTMHASRKPNVNASVSQMMSMGFSNEGGWLTQLLDANDGNITKVLDILQPVRK